ncbi:MarR family winged helix-turn-helix transcriptional regulator [Ovoidimarina sediminis]|uniref:MarR family winged helix-turn-helix transcriptional regulator n=1 Tax=Ovoidimarina sediminis TaxID=3079856 RepID=UPI00290ABE0C|nr:MarR family transcriptional regulator [Rhodophyticola sp. MJ-SS7]MDU8945217.1 MarR family transcriptional regulator [Rhodophyticola sp. MJ-SS7]
MTYRLHDSLGFRLSRVARIQERRLDLGLRAIGLTRTTWCVLLAVGNEGLTQPSDIAEFIGIDRTATSRALRQMEAEGLIARTAGDKDGRTRQVNLTKEGQARLKRGTPVAEDNAAKLANRLGEKDVALLKERLDRLIEGEPLLPKL